MPLTNLAINILSAVDKMFEHDEKYFEREWFHTKKTIPWLLVSLCGFLISLYFNVVGSTIFVIGWVMIMFWVIKGTLANFQAMQKNEEEKTKNKNK
jgi:hypothetical protein